MKRVGAVLLCLLSCGGPSSLALSACSEAPQQPAADGSVSILVSPLANMPGVHDVIVELTPESTGQPIFAHAKHIDGQWRALFSNVPAGDYSVIARALDAAGRLLLESDGAAQHKKLTLTPRQIAELVLVWAETLHDSVTGRLTDFHVVADSTQLAPSEHTALRVLANDGLPHPTWSYVFDDGKTASARGHFTASGDASRQLYTPADCVLLGGGQQRIDVRVAVTDRATGLSGSHVLTLAVACPEPTFYTTKTPYQPKQDRATYEAPPAGYTPVFTQLVSRHGSRGLSSAKYDLATYAIWQRAQADGALTALGQQLGPDVRALIRANALLGVNVPGIKAFGYGNLTQRGISEQKELAARLFARLPDYLGALGSRTVEVVTSGVDRAVDSAGFFVQSLTTRAPSLNAAIHRPPAPSYPKGAPVAQPDGSNRFELYFHKLAAKTDLVTDSRDPYYATYQASLAYQTYLGDDDMNAIVEAGGATPEATSAARVLLERLFAASFVDKIEAGAYTFANTGSFTFTSDDGSVTSTVTGDGKTKVARLPDAAAMLYNLYTIAPAMTAELGLDFGKYFPADAARTYAFLDDLTEFYEAGPSIADKGPVTYQMARSLKADFFAEVDAIAKGDLSHGAKLRFTHAEIIIPFASIMELPNKSEQLPLADTYDYTESAWRGELVSPLTANVQWDVFRNDAGKLLVKMLYNEQESDFKTGCDDARIRVNSHFYAYEALKRCYGL